VQWLLEQAGKGCADDSTGVHTGGQVQHVWVQGIQGSAENDMRRTSRSSAALRLSSWRSTSPYAVTTGSSGLPPACGAQS
jgi:hypothetical protein